jgi:cytolysin-activating lysine-acyltransferase
MGSSESLRHILEFAVDHNSDNNTQKASSRTNKKTPDLRAMISEINLHDIKPQPAGKKTLATVLGEIVWLFSQSPLHRNFKISDLDWALMPALLLDQYKIYKANGQVVAVALWAYLSKESEASLLQGKVLQPGDWGNNAEIDPEDGIVPNEGGQLWLIELVTPFDGPEGRHQVEVVEDLLRTEFSGQTCRSLDINPTTGEKRFKDVRGLSI